MDATVEEHICTSCGGTGVDHQPHGPFYSGIPITQRQAFRDHIQSRHEVFRSIDRSLGKLLVDLRRQKSTLHDDIEHIRVLADSAHQSLTQDPEGALRAVYALATAAVWLLETERYWRDDDPGPPLPDKHA